MDTRSDRPTPNALPVPPPTPGHGGEDPSTVPRTTTARPPADCPKGGKGKGAKTPATGGQRQGTAPKTQPTSRAEAETTPRAIPEHPQPGGRRAAAVYVPLDDLRRWADNPRDNEPAIEVVKASILEFGFGAPLLARVDTGELIAGDTRIQACLQLRAEGVRGVDELPVRYMTLEEARAHALAVVDNRSNEFATWRTPQLGRILEGLNSQSEHLRRIAGYDDAAFAALRASLEPGPPTRDPGPTLADRFMVPPFTVLDARGGVWQARKRQWLALRCIAPKIGSDTNDAAAFQPGDDDPAGHASAWQTRVRDERAAAHKSQDRLQALQRTGSSRVDVDSSPAARGHGSMTQQLVPDANRPGGRRGKAAPRPAPGGAPMLPGSRDPVASARHRVGPRPGGKGSATTPRTSADGKYVGGDAWTGRRLTWAPGDRVAEDLDDTSRRNAAASASGTSIFDPVLIEIMLRWFCPRGGRVLDTFAGGTSAGVVCSRLGYAFTGVEVRADQVAANEETVRGHQIDARWVCGDSAKIDETFPGGLFDMVLTDPPYFTLERYSADARDGSTKQTYAEFLAWYAGILRRAAAVLAPDRFMVVKIGEARDRLGHYPNIVGDTNRVLIEAGLHYYNELILVTAVGSLPVRTARAFEAGRKCGKTHQQVLVFLKGDAKRATAACGKVELPPDLFAEIA